MSPTVWLQGLRERIPRAGYLVLWFLFVVYPFLVVPHGYSPLFLGRRLPPDYYYFPRFAVLLALALAVLFLLLRERPRLRGERALVALGAFLLFAFISTALAAYPAVAWCGSPLRRTGLLTYLACSLLFLLACTTLDEEKTERLLGQAAAAAALVSLLALAQGWGLDLVPRDLYRERLQGFGTMAAPGFLGAYAAFFFPAALTRCLKAGRTSRILWLPVACAVCAGVVASGALFAWLAALAGLVLVAASAWRRPERRLPLGFALAALTAAASGLLLARGVPWAGSPSLLAVPVQPGGPTLGELLYIVWPQCLQLFKCAWDFGIGPDHLVYAGISTLMGVVVDKARNIFLELGVTMGAFALLAYLAFLSFFFRRPRSEQGFLLLAMVLVYLVQGFFSVEDPVLMPLFWTVLGAVLAARRQAAPQAAGEECPAASGAEAAPG